MSPLPVTNLFFIKTHGTVTQEIWNFSKIKKSKWDIAGGLWDAFLLDAYLSPKNHFITAKNGSNPGNKWQTVFGKPVSSRTEAEPCHDTFCLLAS